LNELDIIGNNKEINSYKNNKQFIINFIKQIIEITNTNEFYGESFKNLNSDIDKIQNYELFHSFLVMLNFRLLTGLQWLVKL